MGEDGRTTAETEALEAEQETLFGPELAERERDHPRWSEEEGRILRYDEVVRSPFAE